MHRSTPLLITLFLNLGISALTGAARADSMISGAGPVSTRTISPSQSCHLYTDYAVRVTHDPERIGQHLNLFKFAPGGDAAKTCNLPASQASFNLRNDNANWFIGMSGRYLFVESGTRQDLRRLRIYDLDKKAVSYSADYFGHAVLLNGLFLSFNKYMQELRNPLTDRDRNICPQAGQWIGVGQRVGLYTPYRLDLSTGQDAAVGPALCVSMQ